MSVLYHNYFWFVLFFYQQASGLFGLLEAINRPQDKCFPSSSCNQFSLARMDSHASRNGSEECSVKDWRKIALEQMHQSLNDSEGGLSECIRDAILFHPEGGCTSKLKVHASVILYGYNYCVVLYNLL